MYKCEFVIHPMSDARLGLYVRTYCLVNFIILLKFNYNSSMTCPFFISGFIQTHNESGKSGRITRDCIWFDDVSYVVIVSRISYAYTESGSWVVLARW
jgi:hypothetical protein